MASERVEALSRRCTPKFDRAVVRATENKIVLCTLLVHVPGLNPQTHLEFNASQSLLVSLEDAYATPSFDVPKHHLAITACADHTAVLESHGIHRSLVAAQNSVQCERLAVVDIHQSVF